MEIKELLLAAGERAHIDGLDIRAYLREMNVSERLADEMMKTPPSSVRYLIAEEQESFGLSVIDPIERETCLGRSTKVGSGSNGIQQA